jgi:hypothetical protein
MVTFSKIMNMNMNGSFRLFYFVFMKYNQMNIKM